MPFEKSIIEYITNYIEGHLPKDEWYDEYFSFINDIDLANRLKIEFQNARFIYKLFEGMQAADELLLAEVRTQIIMYVSIYEALIHYILFEYYKDSQEVKDLIEKPTTIQISIPEEKKKALQKALNHDGKEIIPYYIKKKARDITKIRFDEKCMAANNLNLIDNDLTSELIELYEMRNAVHIHAEIRKQLTYELEKSKLAYWRFKKFYLQVTEELKRTGKIK